MFVSPKMPKSVNCFICGRAYGTKSVMIHVKSCQKKWEIEQAQKPKNQRRLCPQPPPGFIEILKKENVSEDELISLN